MHGNEFIQSVTFQRLQYCKGADEMNNRFGSCNINQSHGEVENIYKIQS